ncbi:putative Zn(II)2Cys6 transcription factor [Coniochaeta sp. 2T2.1]|nr:putative Zn(II)2Cys6 transcription factor [Coniochaeta sp. 2T2.1]
MSHKSDLETQTQSSIPKDKRPLHRAHSQTVPNAPASDPGSRKRTRQSCDACKSRKTKCIPSGNGPCKYCASIGRPCSTSVRLQRRPFYRVSEEEYDCSMRLLRHFVPDVTLDLATMKSMLADIDKHNGGPSSAPAIETEESEVLQEELGCMILDARGSYRYVGPDSSVRFANAATAAQGPQGPTAPPRRSNSDPSLIKPIIRSRLPPETPESVNSPNSERQTTWRNSSEPGDHDPERNRKVYYLPEREVCQRYAMRFFEELQSIYWFFSPEQFYTMVDKTYADGGVGSSASWLCSLYCIFSICSARDEAAHGESFKGDRKSSEYLAMAKSLGLQVVDEADADAVRALALMSLALHSSCYTVTAYLIIGMTVRISYSLGLHRNITTRNQDSVTRARLHRLWWTVYLLDQEVAIQLGYPYAIVDDVAGLRTPLPDESILDPGRPTPLGYQAVCVALIKLKKKISHTLYVAPALSTRKVPFSAVAGCMGELRDWLAALPPHLCWSSGMPPSHRRAVAVLHLRYWTTLIHVQRPFLLYTVTRGAELRDDQKKWYEELSNLCLDAAEKSVGILKNMRDHSLLSSLVLFDSQCIQELAHIFMLGRQYNGPRGAAAAAEGLETCLATLRGMEPIGWADKILPELQAVVASSDTESPSSGDVGGGDGRDGYAAAGDGGGSGTHAAAHQYGDGSHEAGGGVASLPQQHPGGGDVLLSISLLGLRYFRADTTLSNIDGQIDVFDTLDLDMETFVAPPTDQMFFQ